MPTLGREYILEFSVFLDEPRRFAAPTITWSRSTVFAWPVKSENESGRNAASTGDTGEASAFVMKPKPFGAPEGISDFGFLISEWFTGECSSRETAGV